MAYLDDSLTDTRYNEWRSMAYEQGATNMCLGFIDENGKLTKCEQMLIASFRPKNR